MVRGEIDTIAHSTLSIGAPIKRIFGMRAGVFNKKDQLYRSKRCVSFG